MPLNEDPLFLVPTLVRRVSKHEIRHTRKLLSKKDKRAFFALAVAEVCRNHKDDLPDKLNLISGFQIHHIVPLGLGGDNSHKNLALVEPKLHSRIHRIIEQQPKLKKQRTAMLKIPRMDGMVWGL